MQTPQSSGKAAHRAKLNRRCWHRFSRLHAISVYTLAPMRQILASP